MGIKQSGSEQAAQHSRSRSCCKVIINQHFRSIALRQMIVESHFQHEHHYVVWLIPSHFILFPIYLSTLRLKQQHTHLYIFVSVHNSQNTISYLLSLFELYFFLSISVYVCGSRGRVGHWWFVPVSLGQDNEPQWLCHRCMNG